jgi:hypothetical protein
MEKNKIILFVFIYIFIISLVFVSSQEEVKVAKKSKLTTHTPSPTSSTSGDFLHKQAHFSTANANALGHLVDGLAYAGTISQAIEFTSGLLGAEKQLSNALSKSSFTGILAGKGAYGLLKSGGHFQSLTNNPAKLSTGIGIAIAVIIILKEYKKKEIETVRVDCLPYSPDIGGRNCQRCNKQIIPCSEYQCKSLGSGCEIINKGSEKQKCVWINRNDVNFPIIQPLTEVLSNDFKYTPNNAVHPDERGVKIINTKSELGCIKPFTPLSFGIKLNEPGQCKIDYLRKPDFENMSFYFNDDNLYKYNHTQILSFPVNSNSPTRISSKGEYELYVRCKDKNGNYNKANFVFKFCVEKSPDTTPPMIIATDLLNNAPIQFNKSFVDIKLYTNEPAECRWSKLDLSFRDMHNKMFCSRNITEFNAQMLYTCETNLTGLKNKVKNRFYFRCIDKPELVNTSYEKDRNVNKESFVFSLIGTIPLKISFVSPNNETIFDSSDVVKVTLNVETFAGYNEGEALCYYSEDGKSDSYYLFFHSNSFLHSQDLFLSEGDYSYFIRCIDLGGNSDFEVVNFSVKKDLDSPKVMRTYFEENNLKVVTNEEAVCVYDVVGCDYLFDDGVKMQTLEGFNHFTKWVKGATYYIKCRDVFGNFEECFVGKMN